VSAESPAALRRPPRPIGNVLCIYLAARAVPSRSRSKAILTNAWVGQFELWAISY